MDEKNPLWLQVVETLHKNRSLIVKAHRLKIKSARLGRQIRSAKNSTMDPKKWTNAKIKGKKDSYFSAYTLRRLERENRLLDLMIRKKMSSRPMTIFKKRRTLSRTGRHRGR